MLKYFNYSQNAPSKVRILLSSKQYVLSTCFSQLRSNKERSLVYNSLNILLIYNSKDFLNYFHWNIAFYFQWRVQWTFLFKKTQKSGQSMSLRYYYHFSIVRHDKIREGMVYSSTKHTLGEDLPIFIGIFHEWTISRKFSNVQNVVLYSSWTSMSLHRKADHKVSRSYSLWTSFCHFSISYRSWCDIHYYLESIRLWEKLS